jgi:hypothetical protein
VANKLRNAYRRAPKKEWGQILKKVQETIGVGRSTARRLLIGPAVPTPKALVWMLRF